MKTLYLSILAIACISVTGTISFVIIQGYEIPPFTGTLLPSATEDLSIGCLQDPNCELPSGVSIVDGCLVQRKNDFPIHAICDLPENIWIKNGCVYLRTSEGLKVKCT